MAGKSLTILLASAGMGYMIAERLALHGAKVWIGARSESRTKQVIQKYDQTYAAIENKGRLVWLPLDLANVKGVAQSAKTFLSSEQKLDILSKYRSLRFGITSTAIKF